MPFTAQESAEILKTVHASKKIEAGVLKLAKFIELQPEGSAFAGQKNSLYSALGTASHQLLWINVVEQNLLWCFEINDNNSGRVDRATNLSRAWTMLDGVIRQLISESIPRTKNVPEFASASQDFQEAVNILSSIDRTLPYGGDNPFPTSYPRIIGPHGNYEMAQSRVAFQQKYLTDFAFKPGQWFTLPNWPNTAISNKYLGHVLENLVKARTQWNRIFCLQGEVVLPEDMKSAQFDFEASSGLRPPSFFLALIAHELAMLDENSKSFSGRFVPPGISSFYRDILNSWRRVQAEVNKVDPNLITEDNLNAGGSPFTVSQFWGKLDTWSQANLGFFFDIPAPPSQEPQEPAVIPAGFFAEQASALASIANQAEAVRLDLISKEGLPV
jgi:hypothetical protein